MVSLIFMSCLGSIKHIPTPTTQSKPKTSPPELIELVLRTEFALLDGDWNSGQQTLTQALYYSPKDPYLLLYAAETAYKMDDKLASHEYLIRAMPIIIQQQKFNDPAIQKRLRSLRRPQ